MFIIIFSRRFLSGVDPIAVFDIKKARFISNLLGLGLGGDLCPDLAHHECHGYKAVVSNLAKLPRNSRGNSIEAKAIPVRLDTEALQAALTSALKPRGRQPGEPPRPLRGGLTAANRHQREKVVTPDILARAKALRAEGHAWKTVGATVGINFEALKTAQRRASRQGPAA